MIETLVLLYAIGVAGFGVWLGYAAEKGVVRYSDVPLVVLALFWPVAVFPTIGEAIAFRREAQVETRGSYQP